MSSVPATADSDVVVECRSVRKSFRQTTALDGVDLTLVRGRVHGLLGPNGAGKSTLMRILFGLIRPDSGTVRVLGATPGRSGGLSLIGVAGFVETPRFHPYLRVRQTLEHLAALDGGDSAVTPSDAIETVGLQDCAVRKVGSLSTGQRQRLGLAAALLRDPHVLVVDEPTTGLDPAGIRDLHGLVADVAAAGRAVLLSSHDMNEVERLCDDVTILDGGRVVHVGSVADLERRATTSLHRLRTRDDRAARDIAASCNGIEIVETVRPSDDRPDVEPGDRPDDQLDDEPGDRPDHEPGVDVDGLVVSAAPDALDELVLALADARIPIRELVRTQSALEAEFDRLVTR